jgi:hypothetical protein
MGMARVARWRQSRSHPHMVMLKEMTGGFRQLLQSRDLGFDLRGRRSYSWGACWLPKSNRR